MDRNTKILVIQIAMSPITGVWSAMRSLMNWLHRQPGLELAAGIFVKKNSWPQAYREDLTSLGIPSFFEEMPSFPGSYLTLFFSRALSRWLEQLYDEFKPRHIVVHSHFSFFSGTLLPIRTDIPCAVSVLVSIHGTIKSYDGDLQLQRWLHGYLARRTMKYASAIVSVDRPSILKVAQLFNIEAQKVRYIPNGLNDPGRSGCPHLDQPNLPFKVGYVGALNENKGWRLVATAVERLYRQGENIRLILAGFGEEAALVADWARAHPEFTTFLGFVPDAGVNLIPQLDVLVLPSTMEGMPMVILEALASGVPVIATPVNAIPDMISHGQNGFLVERDPEQIADALSILLKESDVHRNMSHQALQVFKQYYEISQVGQKYLELYERMGNNNN
jgi:glycosyltransferase involved in cell wall biosynthesis